METKYKCDECNFECVYVSQWKKHIETELHKTGHKKKRSDYKEPFKCENCSYCTKNRTTLKVHNLNMHSDKETRQKEYTYYCDKCDFGTFSKDIYDTHITTKKHKRII